MYLYFNDRGELKEIVNDKALRQGSQDYNYIYVFVEGVNLHTKDISFRYQLESAIDENFVLPEAWLEPEDIVDNIEIPYDEKRDLKYFKYYTPYTFARIPTSFDVGGVLYSVLSKAGSVYLTVYLNSDDVNALGLITFNVEKSANGSLEIQSEEYISLAQFNYLKELIARKELNPYANNLFTVLDDISTADLDIYSVGKLFYDKVTNAFYEKTEDGYAYIGVQDIAILDTEFDSTIEGYQYVYFSELDIAKLKTAPKILVISDGLNSFVFGSTRNPASASGGRSYRCTTEFIGQNTYETGNVYTVKYILLSIPYVTVSETVGTFTIHNDNIPSLELIEESCLRRQELNVSGKTIADLYNALIVKDRVMQIRLNGITNAAGYIGFISYDSNSDKYYLELEKYAASIRSAQDRWVATAIDGDLLVEDVLQIDNEYYVPYLKEQFIEFDDNTTLQDLDNKVGNRPLFAWLRYMGGVENIDEGYFLTKLAVSGNNIAFEMEKLVAGIASSSNRYAGSTSGTTKLIDILNIESNYYHPYVLAEYIYTKSQTYTRTEIDEIIQQTVSSSISYQGTVANYAALASIQNPVNGGIYITEDTGNAYIYSATTSTFDLFSFSVDTSTLMALSGDQTANGKKTFNDEATFNDGVCFNNSTYGMQLNIINSVNSFIAEITDGNTSTRIIFGLTFIAIPADILPDGNHCNLGGNGANWEHVYVENVTDGTNSTTPAQIKQLTTTNLSINWSTSLPDSAQPLESFENISVEDYAKLTAYPKLSSITIVNALASVPEKCFKYKETIFGTGSTTFLVYEYCDNDNIYKITIATAETPQTGADPIHQSTISWSSLSNIVEVTSTPLDSDQMTKLSSTPNAIMIWNDVTFYKEEQTSSFIRFVCDLNRYTDNMGQQHNNLVVVYLDISTGILTTNALPESIFVNKTSLSVDGNSTFKDVIDYVKTNGAITKNETLEISYSVICNIDTLGGFDTNELCMIYIHAIRSNPTDVWTYDVINVSSLDNGTLRCIDPVSIQGNPITSSNIASRNYTAQTILKYVARKAENIASLAPYNAINTVQIATGFYKTTITLASGIPSRYSNGNILVKTSTGNYPAIKRDSTTLIIFNDSSSIGSVNGIDVYY